MSDVGDILKIVGRAAAASELEKAFDTVIQSLKRRAKKTETKADDRAVKYLKRELKMLLEELRKG